MESSLPKLTNEQRKEYLCKAAELRTKRAQLKQKVKTGEVKFSEAMNEPEAQRMHVRELITAVPGYGKQKSQKLMFILGISESRRVRGLGIRQRNALIEALG